MLLVGNRPAAEKRPTEKMLRDEGRIKTMLQYINAHLGEELTTARIARCAAISESECLRCFRSMVGSTPIHYVRTLRIYKAAELLAGHGSEDRGHWHPVRISGDELFCQELSGNQGLQPLEYRRKKQRQGASTPGVNEG